MHINANARVLGSYQQDAIQAHNHQARSYFTNAASGNGLYLIRQSGDLIQDNAVTQVINARTSSETRGSNTAFAPRLICY